jgi:hypothetical protein
MHAVLSWLKGYCPDRQNAGANSRIEFRLVVSCGRWQWSGTKMWSRCGKIAALAIVSSPLPVQSALSQSFDGQYTGKLD